MMNSRKWYSALSRMRHSRGFGVHSPFAYDFITRTLTEKKCAYYCYPELETHPDSGTMKLLVRVLCHLKPHHVMLLPAATPELVDLLTEVDSNIVPTRRSPDMVIVTSDAGIDTLRVIECLAGGGSLFMTGCDLNGKAVSDILGSMTAGMSFSNGHTLIASGRRDLPRQHFEINF